VNFHFISPAHPLAGFVERLWHLNDAPPHFQERIVPSGTMEMVINLHEDELRIYDASRTDHCKRFSGAVVSGPCRGLRARCIRAGGIQSHGPRSSATGRFSFPSASASAAWRWLLPTESQTLPKPPSKLP